MSGNYSRKHGPYGRYSPVGKWKEQSRFSVFPPWATDASQNNNTLTSLHTAEAYIEPY